MKTEQEKALELAHLLEDGKATDAAVIAVAHLSSWTEFFVIATMTSATHGAGLYKQVKDYARDNGMKLHVPVKKNNDGGEDWMLIDAGSVVIHLMSTDARGFYELEKLWQGGTRLR